jgi:hypothetical protein
VDGTRYRTKAEGTEAQIRDLLDQIPGKQGVTRDGRFLDNTVQEIVYLHVHHALYNQLSDDGLTTTIDRC